MLPVILMVMSLMVAIVVGEVGLRFIDGFQPFSVALVPRALTGRPLMPPAPGDAYRGIPLAPSVNEAWFALDPSPISRQPEDGEVATRQAWYPGDSHLAYWEWNRRYLRNLACGRGLWPELSRARSVYLFDSSRDSAYPRFRHVAGITAPEGGMVLNAFGWRGAEIPITKGVGVLRIAFLGASTTLGSPRYAWSYPEHVGAWLNTWARQTGKAITFEIANTGRFGAKSADIVGIAEDEVPAFAPDILVYYEGHNDFQPSFLRCPAGIAPSAERFAFRHGHWLESYSAIVRRLMTVISGVRGPGIGEPPRPDCRLRFPASIDEANPAPDDPKHPGWLQAVFSNLDRIETMTQRTGQRLVVSSFLWMIPDRRILDSQRHARIVQHLDRFYPLRYADLRRLTDYQNRVLANWAKSRRIDFVDTAAAFPNDLSLFEDAIHLNERGQRIQAWIIFQGLIPLIERLLDTGARTESKGAKSAFDAATRARRISVPLEQLAVDCQEL